jgi:hypothetical protein
MQKFIFIILLMIFQNTAFGQYQKPYLIEKELINSIKNSDSIWVLFPDILAVTKNNVYTLPSELLSPPKKNKIGDTIMLDSTYLLDLIITDIKWINPINCYVHYRLPHRQNKVLILNHWLFGKDEWVIEGKTVSDDYSCDILIVSPHEKGVISIKILSAGNCIGFPHN